MSRPPPAPHEEKPRKRECQPPQAGRKAARRHRVEDAEQEQTPHGDAASESVSPPSQDEPQADPARVENEASYFGGTRRMNTLTEAQKYDNCNRGQRPNTGRPTDR